MTLVVRSAVIAAGAVALAAYVALDSLLGDIVDVVLSKGVGHSLERFLALWSVSLWGDAVFVVGSVAAMAIGLTSKRKLGIVYATLITWFTYAVAAAVTFPLPSFGEGSTGPPGPQNFGYMLVGTPIFGIGGLAFTVGVLLVARRVLLGEWSARLKITRPTSPVHPPGHRL